MSYMKGLLYALSLYTRIPVPVGGLKREDGKKAIVFLPFAGIIICALICLLDLSFTGQNGYVFFKMCVYTLVPLIITGGFHLDGFMDVEDAKSSYKSREERLLILKDPHIGAFAVIKLLMTGLVWLGAMSVVIQKGQKEGVWLYALSFFTVRAACGVMSLFLKKAKNDGMLQAETSGTGSMDKVLLIVQLLLGCFLMIGAYPAAGLASVAVLVLFSLYYRQFCYRDFGGVTGDTAGYYITVGETLVILTVAITEILA